MRYVKCPDPVEAFRYGYEEEPAWFKEARRVGKVKVINGWLKVYTGYCWEHLIFGNYVTLNESKMLHVLGPVSFHTEYVQE